MGCLEILGMQREAKNMELLPWRPLCNMEFNRFLLDIGRSFSVLNHITGGAAG